jgi:hypothetical protein
MREGRGVTFTVDHVWGLRKRTVLVRSEGGGVEVDGGDTL